MMNENEDSFFEEDPVLVAASKTKRVINYLVDYIVLAFIISSFLIMWDNKGYGLLDDIYSLRVRIIGALLYALLYVIIESLTGGKSIGKYFTKTRVVEYDGTAPDMETYIIRSFSRIIPFEPISFLFSKEGWHDRFSKTMVIDEELSDLDQINGQV